MTPAIVLDKVLPRWRATLPARYSSDLVDTFISRNRAALETVVDGFEKLPDALNMLFDGANTGKLSVRVA